MRLEIWPGRGRWGLRGVGGGLGGEISRSTRIKTKSMLFRGDRD